MSDSAGAPVHGRQALLCLAPSLSRSTTPTAVRASALLSRLSAEWQITALTEAPLEPRGDGAGIGVRVIRGWRPRRLLSMLRRARLDKLIELLVWPDESVFWVLPAVLAGRRLARETAPSAIVVFMMPYSAGIAGVLLSRLTGLPLILNLDDSLTCSDMHPTYPTRLHHLMAMALEDLYARSADAIVYVSLTNLQAVRDRQPPAVRERFHLVRYGADPAASVAPPPQGERFEIAYVGAMSGWWAMIEHGRRASAARRGYAAWMRLGQHRRTMLDPLTSSPAIIGAAIREALGEHPEWNGRVRLALYGNPYPQAVVERALSSAGIEDLVEVTGPLPHEQVPGILARADLLFIALPARVDGSRGGRISAKTYEYLMTDRPILAAVPRGENQSYLEGKPGVWLVDPDDREGMREAVVQLAADKFAGRPRTFDREALRGELSYDTRAQEFAAVIRAGIERAARRDRRRRWLR